jgi:hypothetical protein
MELCKCVRESVRKVVPFSPFLSLSLTHTHTHTLYHCRDVQNRQLTEIADGDFEAVASNVNFTHVLRIAE